MTKTYILGQGYVEHTLVPWEQVETMPEFYDRMKAYDWTTAMSDDHSVWQRGERSWNQEFKPCLDRMREKYGEQALLLFAEMKKWAWGEGNLPERPKL
jgi:hypothetical protein